MVVAAARNTELVQGGGGLSSSCLRIAVLFIPWQIVSDWTQTGEQPSITNLSSNGALSDVSDRACLSISCLCQAGWIRNH